jgi:hypothetical protein
MTTNNNEGFWPGLVRALLVQLVLLAIASFGLPQDVFVRACCLASLGFWTGVLLILIRRPIAPTKGDLDYIRLGLIPVGVLGMIAALGYWSFIGVLDMHHPRNIPRPGEIRHERS